MLKINKTDISITRGDSAYINFTLKNNSGETVNLSYVDKVRVQVRDKAVDGELVFEGTIDHNYQEGTIIWHITPEDTKYVNVGTYYWDAQVEYGFGGDVFTFIDVSKFVVLPEVTMAEE